MQINQLKFVLTCILGLFLSALSSCQESPSAANESTVDENSGNNTPYMAVMDAFSCKPSKYIFVAAHRGTHKGSQYPENALESLQALYAKGIIFAEIDIARLKDGTLILHHDGTWDRGSTGKGAVSATNRRQAQKMLLKDTNGKITAFRPSEFREVLKWAKYKMYLEIDFKSSASEAKVVRAIKSADMLNQVILIAYSKAQAARLHKLAPSAAISVKISKPGDIKAYEVSGVPIDVMTAWTSRGPLDKKLAADLRSKHIPILGSGNNSSLKRDAVLPDLLVSDYPLDIAEAFVIKGKNKIEFKKCMAEIGRGD